MITQGQRDAASAGFPCAAQASSARARSGRAVTQPIESLIRAIPDFPIPGILFRDITPLLADPQGFKAAIDLFVKRFRDAVMMIKGLGISLLLAESNLTSAAAIADRLYVVDRGEIIFHGTPPQALANETVMRTLRG